MLERTLVQELQVYTPAVLQVSQFSLLSALIAPLRKETTQFIVDVGVEEFPVAIRNSMSSMNYWCIRAIVIGGHSCHHGNWRLSPGHLAKSPMPLTIQPQLLHGCR